MRKISDDIPPPGRRTTGPTGKVLGLLRVIAKGDRRASSLSGFASLFKMNGVRNCRRIAPRRRVRLMSGKLVDDNLNFIVECTLQDHSHAGCRLQLAREIELPASFRVYLDKDASILVVSLVWKRGANVGLRILDHVLAPSEGLAPPRWRSLGQRYYALD